MARSVHPGYASPEEGLANLLAAEGGCAPPEEAARIVDASVAEIVLNLNAGELVGYRDGSGSYYIPLWQFRDGNTLSGLTEVLAVIRVKLSHAGNVFPFCFFLQADPVTGGKTPLEALRNGEIESVLRAVDGYVG